MFLATSDYLKKIKKLADMCKDLKVNVYIWGERGVGKTFLAKYIAPNAVMNPKTSTINPVIIEDFDKNPVFDVKGSVVVATGTNPLNKDILKKYFTMDIELKPLREHPEDIGDFLALFEEEARGNLKIEKKITINSPDISENLNSLKRQVYREFLMPSNIDEVFSFLQNAYEKYTGDVTYEKELKKFEKTLFSAMKKRYKSKLQISQNIKINRVTLTKKMKELDV
jgi:DNA-binding NtrC family response regulator